MTTRIEIAQPDAELPTIVLHDRRKKPERRTLWRGGRRDSDWLNRPPDALSQLERLQRRQRGSAWRRWLATSSSLVGRSIHSRRDSAA